MENKTTIFYRLQLLRIQRSAMAGQVTLNYDVTRCSYNDRKMLHTSIEFHTPKTIKICNKTTIITPVYAAKSLVNPDRSRDLKLQGHPIVAFIFLRFQEQHF